MSFAQLKVDVVAIDCHEEGVDSSTGIEALYAPGWAGELFEVASMRIDRVDLEEIGVVRAALGGERHWPSEGSLTPI